jgi:hypothetical protein
VVPSCAHDLRLEFDLAGLPTFNSPQANLGAALAHLQQANPSPEAEAAMAYIWVATRWRRRARRPSRLHLRQAGTRAADLIGLRIADSPRSRRRSTKPKGKPRQPLTYAPTSTRTDIVVMLAAT